MDSWFLDTSALVKRYVQESGSGWVRSLFQPVHSNEIVIARITAVEVVAALSRRTRMGSISQPRADSAWRRFRKDYPSRFLVVPITASLIESAMRLASQHGLRGYDAVQLAAAWLVNRRLLRNHYPKLTFITADVQLGQAAAAEGLATDDPNAHP